MSERKKLNPEQIKAVEILEGPVLVLAGAGSGKTRVVTTRVVHLIESGISPSAILGVTFTNKAAGEMQERIKKLTEHSVLICTFHSLGARILRESINALGYRKHFTIYDEDDAEKLIKACLNELNINDKKMEPKIFKSLISKSKNALISPENSYELQHSYEELNNAFPKVYSLYQKKLFDYQAVDFDDLLFLTVKLFIEHPDVLARYQERWPFVLVDEYQDTNASQYTITKLLVEKSQNLFVVGDPDQSIYSWRGANVQNILNFKKDYPEAKVIQLEQNYRSRSNILDAANALISYNHNRYEKELWSDLGPGEKIKLFIGENEKEEANFVASQVYELKHQCNIPLNDIVVFYRTNAQSRTFEDSLIYRKIPYVIVGGISFYQRREIKDMMAFLRIAHSDSDFIAFARSINLPKRGLGDTTIEKLRWHAHLEKMSIIEYCEALINDRPLINPLKLSANQKKGLNEYLVIIQELHLLSQQSSIHALVSAAIEQTNYLKYLMEDPETLADRKENLDALLAKALEWDQSAPDPSLRSFLEELSLKSSLDETNQAEERLALMTIHNGKGLEFNTAFLVGLEEDLFPHANSRLSPEAVEEERRLCYVGITRAKERLFLSYCKTRYLWGALRMEKKSRFLNEIPHDLLEKVKFPSLTKSVFRPNVETLIKKQKEFISHRPAIENESFNIGDCVKHKDFGKGEVQDVYEGSMGVTYKIRFEKDGGLKTIIAKYAHLIRC
ncbi:MAG: UvrD-helicase domain-containing protein [Parachlamydiaceae bacterium]|nr:UvrD-helicase domain-containing protein [Parachlamydiaceae bacterium]